MNVTEIQKRLTDLRTAATDLGFYVMDCDFHINWINDGIRIRFEIRDSHKFQVGDRVLEKSFGGWNDEDSRAATADNLEECFTALSVWLYAQKTPNEARQEVFTKRLAKLIEEGRELGTPVLADLEATMKRLSTNILENHAA